VYVYVNVVVPGFTPVTTPVTALIVAIVLSDVDHKPPDCALAIETVPFSQTDVEPIIAVNTGRGFTVTIVAAEVAVQPLFVVMLTE
jgi:hypothetical protein